MVNKSDIKILFSEEEIEAKVKELAAKIDEDYKDIDDIVLVGVLKGSFIFLSDLARAIKLSCQIEFIRVSSYDSGTESSGTVKALDLTLPELAGKNVIIVEDIVDSGRTAKFLLDFFALQSGAKTIKLATLFDKPCRRVPELKDIQADYTCFEIDDKFILGYGLDVDQEFRDLPYIGYIQ
ncbi:MAG: hypoxanthine phosphoribosyltransferase [Candidatus Melainabacteria bacterium]|nr:hypoxanthine phosphoribosyltransferase [Candidatus Melainabacteria bacterium]